jgi:hypothetical protein
MPRRDRPTIEEILDRGMLRRMADAGSFERGEDYVEGGQVRSFVVHEGASAAVFSFLSGLYLRGKLAYAQAFACPRPPCPVSRSSPRPTAFASPTRPWTWRGGGARAGRHPGGGRPLPPAADAGRPAPRAAIGPECEVGSL